LESCPNFFKDIMSPLNALDALKQVTTVVADTGNFELMRAYQPQDATTNPTLIIRALDQPEYAGILQQVRLHHQGAPADLAREVLVHFGGEILKIVPGRVSTEVDARHSFNTEATIREAHQIMARYQAKGHEPSRVLIKIAATWEGIRAARQLEREGIACNVTLIFSLAQAALAADAGVTLISPFVGRISDWYKKAGASWDSAASDPGVLSVKRIYCYLKQHGYATSVMGASFRHVDQVIALAGCDLLTVSPDLLEQLQQDTTRSTLVRQLDPKALTETLPALDLTEPAFRFQLNDDAMASDKLAEGIRAFVIDGQKLDARLAC